MIEQVLLNLMRNAIEAMGKPYRKDGVSSCKPARHDGVIEVRVIDNGSGIADAVKERLFHTLLSTKPDGMGMGLNICRSIIRIPQGSLLGRGQPGGGTIFVFTLPLAGRERPQTS